VAVDIPVTPTPIEVRARPRVNPICPQCGCWLYLTNEQYMANMVVDTTCPCGWHGLASGDLAFYVDALLKERGLI
jgi:hypothetical protein